MGILWLFIGIPLGFGLGFLGTLTGIGGGFLLLPILVLLLPNTAIGALALISLTVVFFNSLSGTLLALRRSRLRLRTGLVYGMLSLPAVWWGSHWQALVDQSMFRWTLGVLLLAGAALLVFGKPPSAVMGGPSVTKWALGALISSLIGAVSGFFALGGGFLFLPLLIYLLRFEVDQASATTQMIVGIGSVFALWLQLGHATLPLEPMLVAGLVTGVLVGSPVGASAARTWKTERVLRLLSGLLVLVGLKFLLLP